MKLLLIATLLILTPVLQQPAAVQRDESDVVVLKFKWNRLRQNNDLIHSALDPGPSMNEPMSIRQAPPRNEPAEVRNRRDMLERRADMKASEENAAQSNARKQDQYFLHLEVKNAGANVIKSIIWEYQPTSEPSTYELRQYVCTMKAKPNESKTFELVSPVSPVKVVETDAKTGEMKDGRVVINRIEYADGSIWKRKGWSVLIPADMTDKMGNGKCVLF